MVFLWCSYCFPVVSLWCCYGSHMVSYGYRWFPYCFLLVFLFPMVYGFLIDSCGFFMAFRWFSCAFPNKIEQNPTRQLTNWINEPGVTQLEDSSELMCLHCFYLLCFALSGFTLLCLVFVCFCRRVCRLPRLPRYGFAAAATVLGCGYGSSNEPFADL